ncbi:lysozyme inhibitor LprI family protein [Flavobacterium sp. UBA7680]|uniref:lysozyme inhibitor LprI family protein n=1 Tax=Flavobacterium sp. UBA7680 TaxID=1946559 RepID=UPI0025BBBE13|nr:lysozyme inhibitor LprI family protein [Flavobacterium sp. UBA7680]
MDIDYSTAGMNITVDELTTGYDKLMNKYYNKLMKSLKPEDKKVLITAQKVWLAFRDSEIKLIGTMTEDQYSGGGTMQSNIRMGQYSSLVVERTIDIFHYYNGIVKD